MFFQLEIADAQIIGSTETVEIFFGHAFLLIGILSVAAPIGGGCCARAASAELPVDQISTLPFHLKDDFILIGGQVNGTRGVFNLDTGMADTS